MRIALMGLTCALVTGCASTPGESRGSVLPREEAKEIATAPDRYDALPAQTLGDGECGIFLFKVREPHTFTLFENEAQSVVKILNGDQIIETGVTHQTASFIEGDAFRRVYLARDEQLTFTLTGSVGAETVSGQLLSDVVLKARELDGTETVQPLGGARQCRDLNRSVRVN